MTSRLLLYATLAHMVTACSDSGKRDCPADERINLIAQLTVGDVCAATNYAVIVRFLQPQTVEQVLPLLEPVYGTLACDDPAALAGQPGKTCYIVRLGGGICYSDAYSYFTGLGTPLASTDVPHPETPCSCETHWTQQ